MRYVMNAAVITNPGTFRYRTINLEEAKELLSNQTFISAVGHEGTAAVASQLTGFNVAYNRQQVTMNKGDDAVVFKPKVRLPEGQILDSRQLLEMLEIGWLERVE
ncbi:MAG: hypothetical protein KatS3mg087_2126 [Patescibacteria group bacterium]|nr:MAG: hypothetical protein KatS3mg087_2126 [Patescibacteria group bacterium]